MENSNIAFGPEVKKWFGIESPAQNNKPFLTKKIGYSVETNLGPNVSSVTGAKVELETGVQVKP